LTSAGDNEKQPEKARRLGWVPTLLLCLLILLAGAAATMFFFLTEPEAERAGATRETAMLVSVTRAERGDFRPHISVMGTVEPSRDIRLMPRVSGEIVWRAASFTPGGIVRKGEELLRIDPADYEIALRQRKSELSRAEADLALEMGRQDVARKDYELLNEDLSRENRALVLRKPQLRTARAAVEAARAAVDEAELALSRTRIKAPFDALVAARQANIGSLVGPGDPLGRLVGLENYWVAAAVPLAKLKWLRLPGEDGEDGSPAEIRNRAAWPADVFRKGRLHKLVGMLQEETRMARVLIEVPDPLSGPPDAPPLMIGAFVEVQILGRTIPDVIRLDRDFIRSGGTLWVMEDGELSIRKVDITYRDAEFAYIRKGVEAGEQVVTSSLATVVEGAKLRIESDADEAEKNHESPAGPSS
jgi:RND family efflux transporter MFP subunit